MARSFRPVARLIAAILLLQTLLAPAHCLAMAAMPAGLEAVLCSPDGMHSIQLGPDGQEMPVQAPMDGFCVACHGTPHFALPEGPQPPTPAWVATGRAWQPEPPEALPPARAPPFTPRGPPAASA